MLNILTWRPTVIARAWHVGKEAWETSVISHKITDSVTVAQNRVKIQYGVTFACVPVA